MGVFDGTKKQLRFDTLFSILMVSLGCAAIVLSEIRFCVTGDIRLVVSDVPDDTAYFYKIAWNVVKGKGFTFDGINPTNGFQPLWLYVLLPLAWYFQDAFPEDYFRAALAYQAFFVLVSGVLLFFTLRKVWHLSSALVAAAMFFLLSRFYFINGMETGVLLLCCVLVLSYALHHKIFFQSNPKAALGFGGLLGLLLLARLDMIFLIAVLYFFALGRLWRLWRRGERISAATVDVLFSLIALILVSAPYFVYNKLAFGAIMPISGSLKNGFPYITQPEFGLERFRLRDLVAVAIAFAYCLWFLLYLHKKLADIVETQRHFLIASLIGSLTVLIHYLNTALFMKWAVFSWHFAFYYFNLCLVFAATISYFLNRYSYLQKIAFVGSIVAMFFVSGYSLIKVGDLSRRSSWHSVSYEAAVWARNNTPPDAVFAMKDAGIFGLFSMRTVINLDGLVNNMEYQEALRRKSLNAYLERKGVHYLVQHASWSIPEHNLILLGKYDFIELRYRSYRYNTSSEPIRLYKRDEVYRKVYYEKAKKTDTVFAIWQIRRIPDKP